MAEVLKAVSKDFREFYDGKLSEEIIDGLAKHGVPVTYEDFAKFKGERVDPLVSSYKDYILYELPPNSQGITTLQLLKLMELTEVNRLPYDDKKRIDSLLTLYKIIYEDRNKYVADPRFMELKDISSLLREDYLRQRLNSANFNSKLDPANDTTFFLVTDGENEVGFIQSLFHHFGSGIVVKDIPFNNRGFAFTEGVNSIAPHKRPLHTLSILYAEKNDGKESMLIGCAGADLRPQIHASILTYVVDYGMEIDQAVNAPRFAYVGDKVLVEKRLSYPGEMLDYYDPSVGVAQAMRRKGGVYIAAADPRSDGIALSA